MTCPHCGDEHLEKGATGLDLCTRCGGLSRDGHALDAPIVPVYGVVVQTVIADGGTTGLAVTFYLRDGRQLPPFLITGAQATDFGRLVADALATLERTRN